MDVYKQIDKQIACDGEKQAFVYNIKNVMQCNFEKSDAKRINHNLKQDYSTYTINNCISPVCDLEKCKTVVI